MQKISFQLNRESATQLGFEPALPGMWPGCQLLTAPQPPPPGSPKPSRHVCFLPLLPVLIQMKSGSEAQQCGMVKKGLPLAAQMG